MSNSVQDHFNVCGVVIHVNPDKLDKVRAALAALPAAEIHSITDDSRLVVTVIDTDEQLAIDQLAAINRFDGVVSATLAYHEVDRGAEPQSSCGDGCGCHAEKSTAA